MLSCSLGLVCWLWFGWWLGASCVSRLGCFWMRFRFFIWFGGGFGGGGVGLRVWVYIGSLVALMRWLLFFMSARVRILGWVMSDLLMLSDV